MNLLKALHILLLQIYISALSVVGDYSTVRHTNQHPSDAASLYSSSISLDDVGVQVNNGIRDSVAHVGMLFQLPIPHTAFHGKIIGYQVSKIMLS